jgi:hypothetical protein
MRVRVLSLVVAVSLPAAFVACSSSTPNQPSVTFVAPLAQQPLTGATFKFNQQPIALTIANAARTGSAAVTYSVDVATDNGFANKVFSQTGIGEGTGGTTTVQVSQLLGNKTYYWRSRATVEGTTGQSSAVQSFFVGPNVVLQPPQIQTPADGSNTFGSQATFVVVNAGRTGPAGPIVYDFQVSALASFATTLASATIPEQQGSQTTVWTPSTPLPFGTPLFWRARADDPANSLVGPFSSTASFQFQAFSLTMATILNSPPDIGSWPETTNITDLEMRPSGIHIEFDKLDGPNRWPDVVPPGFNGGIEYTLGMVLNINGHWYASAPIQMWNGLDQGGGPPSEYALNWFYDPARWAPMTFHQPGVGETIGMFVAEGSTRNDTLGLSSPLRERSNVVFIPMPDDNGATYTFSRLGRIIKSTKLGHK